MTLEAEDVPYLQGFLDGSEVIISEDGSVHMGDIRNFVLEVTFGWLLVSVIAVMFLCLISFVAGYWNALTDLLPDRRP